jgi:hypothetical protein
MYFHNLSHPRLVLRTYDAVHVIERNAVNERELEKLEKRREELG